MATSREHDMVFVLAAARATQNVRFASRDDVATVGNFHIRGSITRRALLSNPPPTYGSRSWERAIWQLRGVEPGGGRERQHPINLTVAV